MAVWGFWRKCGVDEGWRIEWIPGSWMSHQRCAGWLGGKAEFPCGLEGGCERRRVAGRLWFGRLRFCVSVREVVSVGALQDARGLEV